MSSSEAYVSFQGVQKSYDGETLVVKDLNLDTQRGEFLTMLGPSGSGKTTCLMMLAGFETVTHGEIILDGTSINNVPPHKRNIGMVFQNYALFPHMTVNENLAFPLQVRKMSKSDIEDRVKMFWIWCSWVLSVHAVRCNFPEVNSRELQWHVL
jgi:putative spermidine/putrescine transport system ATP-binding protein